MVARVVGGGGGQSTGCRALATSRLVGTARPQDPPDSMFDHQAELTGLTGADGHAMKSRQSKCCSSRQGSAAHDGA
jgi:hypothetical protein